MLKRSVVGIVLLLPVLLAAQVTVNVQLPPAGMIRKDQLWNLIMVNNNKEMIETIISLDLRDAVTGQTVLSAGSRSFMLGKGVKVIGIRDVQPVMYNYQAAEFTGTYLPLGSYIACYRVSRSSEKEPEPLGDECVRVNISPLSPPLLTTPADKDTLHTVYPSLSWLPPAPADMFSSLSYDISVAEVTAGQSPAEAILYNTPVYTGHNLKAAYLNYPSGYAKLREGQQYAWQVTARNGMNYAAQTEIWTFTVRPDDSVEKNQPDVAYVLLKNSNVQSGVNYITDNNLFIKYYSFDKAHEATVRFYSGDNSVVGEVKRKIAYGDNFLRFELDRRFSKGEVYFVQLADQQSNIYMARFSIQ